MNKKNAIIAKFENLDLSGKLTILATFILFIEIIVQTIFYNSSIGLFHLILNIIVIILLLAVSPSLEDSNRYYFYNTTGMMVLMNVGFQTTTVIGEIGIWIVDIIFALILADFIISSLTTPEGSKKENGIVLLVGALLFLIENLIWILNQDVLNYNYLIATGSFLLLCFAVPYMFSKLKFLSSLMILLVVVLNLISSASVTGYSAGITILGFYSIMIFIDKTSRNAKVRYFF
ncbi:MAG: hypothetical protein GF364_16565 [Candidatus Lokiarchaeota archaeon]|nr:hypothetical protein [Candidatus Lokiarchaeota archaeon]